MITESDISLVTQVTVFHNKRAFGKIVEKYQSPLRRFFLNLTKGDAQLSDDLAQETFIKAYTRLEQFRGASSFQTWLYRIAYHVFYDDVRGKKYTEDISDLPTAAQTHEDRDAGMKLDLQDALAVLSSTERTCITLQLMEGQSIEDISHIMDMAEGTVKSHLSRGKKKLANYLIKNGYEYTKH